MRRTTPPDADGRRVSLHLVREQLIALRDGHAAALDALAEELRALGRIEGETFDLDRGWRRVTCRLRDELGQEPIDRLTHREHHA